MIKKYRRLLLNNAFLALGIFLIYACASVSAPTGGPKDETPPKPLSFIPENYSTNFDSKTIEIIFDEYVEIKELQKNLIISPPLEKNPLVTVKGKIVIIEIEEELADSTTYNMYFGNSIRDFNESNPIENFQYVFSTGSYIDSMSIAGNILDAYNLVPAENVLVMLYSNLNDSVPMQSIPEYISRTNDKGYFKINNIRNDTFKIFCLIDNNSNYLYDQNDENIAFIDSLIAFKEKLIEVKDTIFKKEKNISIADSVFYTVDSTKIDTVISSYKNMFVTNEYHMFLFNENKKNQYIKENKRTDLEKIQLVFNDKIKDSILVNLLDSINVSDWYIKEENKTKDTIVYWLTDSLVYNNKEINIEVKYYKKDTLNNYQLSSDTLKMRFFEDEKKKNDEKNKYLPLKFNLSNSKTFDLNKNISIDSYFPINKVDTSKIRFFRITDSIQIAQDFVLNKDSSKLRHYIFSFKKIENKKYGLKLFPGAFTDIYNNINDTVDIVFNTQKMEYYGKLFANISVIDSTNIIVQLLKDDDKESLIKEKFISKNGTVIFDYLQPNEYIFKVIIDKNNNKKWDTGNYFNKLQPEEVLYRKEKIKVRSNWDVEVNFNIKKE